LINGACALLETPHQPQPQARSLATARSRLVIFRFRFPFHHFRQELPIMKKLFAFSLSLAAVFLMATAFSAHAVRPDLPMPPPIGATIDEFTLPDTNGKDHTLASLKGKNGTVLIFIAVQCTISNAYN